MNGNPSPEKTQQKTQLKQPAKKRRRMGRFFDLLLLLALIAIGAMFVQAEKAKRAAQEELQKTSSELQELRQNTENSGQQVAAEVLEKLRKHIDVPNDPQPTVATITNIDELRTANEFYTVAENGDHLIITQKRAILYDPDRDIILDVVPVRINQNAQATPTPGEPNSNTQPTPEPTPSPPAQNPADTTQPAATPIQ